MPKPRKHFHWCLCQPAGSRLAEARIFSPLQRCYTGYPQLYLNEHLYRCQAHGMRNAVGVEGLKPLLCAPFRDNHRQTFAGHPMSQPPSAACDRAAALTLLATETLDALPPPWLAEVLLPNPTVAHERSGGPLSAQCPDRPWGREAAMRGNSKNFRRHLLPEIFS
jgi:hypothetical protein